MASSPRTIAASPRKSTCRTLFSAAQRSLKTSSTCTSRNYDTNSTNWACTSIHPLRAIHRSIDPSTYHSIIMYIYRAPLGVALAEPPAGRRGTVRPSRHRIIATTTVRQCSDTPSMEAMCVTSDPATTHTGLSMSADLPAERRSAVRAQVPLHGGETVIYRA